VQKAKYEVQNAMSKNKDKNKYSLRGLASFAEKAKAPEVSL